MRNRVPSQSPAEDATSVPVFFGRSPVPSTRRLASRNAALYIHFARIKQVGIGGRNASGESALRSESRASRRIRSRSIHRRGRPFLRARRSRHNGGGRVPEPMRGDEEFHVGVGAHDGADIAAVENGAGRIGGEAALRLDQRRAAPAASRPPSRLPRRSGASRQHRTVEHGQVDRRARSPPRRPSSSSGRFPSSSARATAR